jgi:hypothetical protein
VGNMYLSPFMSQYTIHDVPLLVNKSLKTIGTTHLRLYLQWLTCWFEYVHQRDDNNRRND